MNKSPVETYLNSISITSRRSMLNGITVVAMFFKSRHDQLAWHELRYEQSQALRDFLISNYKARTVNKVLAAYRGVLKAAWRLDLMTTDEFHHAADVKVAKISEPVAGRMLTLEELRALITHGDGSPSELKVSALITLLYAAGLRRFEVVGLKRSNYDASTGKISLKGKGKKYREVVISKAWRAPINAWLKARGEQLPNEPIFEGSKKGKPMSLSGISYLIEMRRIEAGVEPFTTHDMRRTFITNLIESGADLVVVKRIAGHANINTTAMYDRRGKEAEEAAIDKLEGLEK